MLTYRGWFCIGPVAPEQGDRERSLPSSMETFKKFAKILSELKTRNHYIKLYLYYFKVGSIQEKELKWLNHHSKYPSLLLPKCSYNIHYNVTKCHVLPGTLDFKKLKKGNISNYLKKSKKLNIFWYLKKFKKRKYF